jgi:orotate phosphoribosyltransferase
LSGGSGPIDDELYRLVKERAYREGTFTLSSGKTSPYYFDGKKVLLDQEGARLFCRWMLDRMQRLDPRPVAIGGMEIGAIPIASVAMALCPFPLRTFFVRKQPKAHGTASQLEGDVKAGDRVVVVEDVVTTGESTLKALRVLEQAGCQVAAIYCLVDRQEGHTPEFDRYAPIFAPAFTIQDFRRG